MNRSRLLLPMLALTALATSANAQFIDIVINTGSGWVLNTSLDEVGQLVESYDPPRGFPCQSTDGQTAHVEWDVRLALGFNCRASGYTVYSGDTHAGCELFEVTSDPGLKTGYVTFVRSSGPGSFEFDLWSNSNGTDSDPHPTGVVESELTITLYSPWVPQPPLVKPPFDLALSTSASVTGAGSLVLSQWTRTDGTKTNRDYLSVTVAVAGFSTLDLPAALVDAFASAGAKTNGNSFIRLKP